MKGKSFEIKVSDLLHHLGSDRISFEKETSPLLPQLSNEGMNGVVSFHSIDGESILVTLQDFDCVVEEVCDSCESAFLRPLHIEEYPAKFTLNPKELEDSSDEVLFLIHPKNETINIEEMLYQAVLLQEPFVKRCPSCEESFSKKERDDEETDERNMGGRVQFRGL
ncbi:MAG: hypothetical protein LBH96_00665 [Candidatus Peribacteria bacterium]|jgi:uncharacterized metal-binding protein YceD (DUF177 family)|nr:hypothetical protein [Candidatus Peribacteria bacterium]